MNFNPLFVTPQWINEYYTKYPHGMSVLENIIEWVNQTNELIDWVNMTPQKLEALISEWNDSGKLNFILNEAVATEISDIVTYKPNGVDDTSNIQSLLNTHGAVRLAAGTHIITKLALGPGQYLTGEGRGRTILKLKDNTWISEETALPMIKISNGVGGGIKNLTLDGNKANNPYFRRENPDLFNSIDLLLVEVPVGVETSSIGLEIENLMIRNSRNNGLHFNSKSWNWVFLVRNIMIMECDGYGFKNGTTDNTFSDFYISNCKLAGALLAGSHNKYINFKIDGSGVVNDNPFPYVSDGANLILSSVSASQFINFDIQSAHYIGAKIYNSSACEFNASFDSNGLTGPGTGLYVYNSENLIGNVIFTDVMNRQSLDLVFTSNSKNISFNCETIHPNKIINDGDDTIIGSLRQIRNELKAYADSLLTP